MFKEWQFGAGKMDQQLRVLVALAEDQGSVSSTDIVTHNYSSRRSGPFFWALWSLHVHGILTHMQARHMHIPL